MGNDRSVERGWLLKCKPCGWNFGTNAQVIQETQTIFGHIPKEEFGTNILKKWVERMKSCLAANGWYFEKESVKCTVLERRSCK